jgi:hypothetical protein
VEAGSGPDGGRAYLPRCDSPGMLRRRSFDGMVRAKMVIADRASSWHLEPSSQFGIHDTQVLATRQGLVFRGHPPSSCSIGGSGQGRSVREDSRFPS